MAGKPEAQSKPDYAGLAKTDIKGYVQAVYASPEYNALTEEGKRSTRDYMYQNDIVPFFKNKGEAAPPRSSLEAPGTTVPEPESKLGRLAIGGAKGLSSALTGMVKLPLELHDFSLKAIAKLTGQEEPKDLTAVTGRAISLANDANAGVQNYLHDAFGEPQTTGGALSEEAGKLIGLIPSFIGAGKILKGFPILAQMAEGGAAVPLAFKNLPTSVRAIAASSVIQKSLFQALEGGLAATTANEPDQAGTWAVFGGALPIGWAGIKKAITATVVKDGAQGVGQVFAKAMDWAAKAKGARPKPTNADEALQAVVGTKLDEAASKIEEGKDFSQVSPKTQEEVSRGIQQQLAKAVSEPDEDVVAELAGTEHEVASTLSPLAKQTDDGISAIAKQAGVKTPKEIAATKAAKDTQRATVADKVKNQPVTQTVPEADHTLQDQLDAVIAGNKQAMVLPNGRQAQLTREIPDHIGLQTFRDGTLVVFDKRTISSNRIKELYLKNRLHEAVDYPVSKEDVAKAVAKGEEPVTISATHPVTGAEQETVAASSSSAVETVEAVQKHFPEAEVTVGGPEKATEAVKNRLVQSIKHAQSNITQVEAYGIMLKKEMPPATKAQAELADAIKNWKEAGLPEDELNNLLRENEARHIQVLDQAKASASAQPAVAAPVPEVAAKPATSDKLVSAVKEYKAAESGIKSEPDMIKKMGLIEDLNKKRLALNKIAEKEGVSVDELLADKPATPVTEPVSQIEKPTVKAAKKAKASEMPSDKNIASGLAVKIEIRKSGLAENEAYAILKKHGYTSTKDIPEGQEAEDVLEEIRAAAIKKTPFYPAMGNSELLTSDPASAAEGAQKVILKPTKVLNMDTGFDPVFARHVNEDFPELQASAMKPQEAFTKLVDKLKDKGDDAVKDWLVGKGYDLLHQESGDGTIVEVLNKDVVKTISMNKAEKMADAAIATGATTLEQARASVKAAKDVEAELTRLREEAIAKGEVTIQRFDANGKIKKEKWKPGPGAANNFDPSFEGIAHDIEGASPEELARGEVNYKVDRSGKLSYLGAKIDAGTLKDNEAVVAINKKTGKLRVVNSNFQMSDQSVIDRFGDVIKKAVK